MFVGIVQSNRMSSLEVFERYMDLPQELRYLVLLRCDYRTLREYCKTSKFLRREVKECGWFWELLTRRDFEEFYEIDGDCDDWRDIYFHFLNRAAMELVGYSRAGNVDKVRSFLKVLPHPNLQVDEENKTLIGTTGEVYISAQTGTQWTGDGHLVGLFGWTSLMTASNAGHHIVVRELLRNGADPDITSCCGDIALVGASEQGYTKVVRLLLQYSAKVDIIGKYKRTALMQASQQGSLGVVRELLNMGANPDLQDENGETALIQAVWRGYSEIVQLLCDHGADPRIQDLDDATAIDVCTRSTCANAEITKILLERVALNFDARALKLEKS